MLKISNTVPKKRYTFHNWLFSYGGFAKFRVGLREHDKPGAHDLEMAECKCNPVGLPPGEGNCLLVDSLSTALEVKFFEHS